MPKSATDRLDVIINAANKAKQDIAGGTSEKDAAKDFFRACVNDLDLLSGVAEEQYQLMGNKRAKPKS